MHSVMCAAAASASSAEMSHTASMHGIESPVSCIFLTVAAAEYSENGPPLLVNIGLSIP